LTELDIWFQIGLLYEQQHLYQKAKDTYELVLKDSPKHAKVLQKLGWLHHQPGTPFNDPELAISLISKAIDAGIM
jgi:general transcriptional corepressor CYC8